MGQESPTTILDVQHLRGLAFNERLPTKAAGTNHPFLTNGTRHEHIDCSNAPLTYFSRVHADIRERTETAMTQAHAIEVTRLALTAEANALRLGNLS